jgi:hypothetical protein
VRTTVVRTRHCDLGAVAQAEIHQPRATRQGRAGWEHWRADVDEGHADHVRDLGERDEAGHHQDGCMEYGAARDGPDIRTLPADSALFFTLCLQ